MSYDREYWVEYRKKNRDRLREQEATYAETRKRWYEANREKKQVAVREWRAANREHEAATKQAWKEDHRASQRESERRRRALKRGASEAHLHWTEWEELLIQYDRSCAYCGGREPALEQEHKTPLSRGGTHTRDNIVPACGEYNRRKGAKTVAEFREPRK